jgi:triphosphoribosyl-dephospho-CoA synthase
LFTIIEASQSNMSESPVSASEVVDSAQLALLLDIGVEAKPGNVDRDHDLEDLTLPQFLAGAADSRTGLERAAAGAPLGEAFERGVRGMVTRTGENTQFGCLLLLTPLVSAATQTVLTPAGLRDVLATTTVDDAVNFYRAFDHVDVAVGTPPASNGPPDVRLGAAAEQQLRDEEWRLIDIMEASSIDENATEWTTGFKRTFSMAKQMQSMECSLTERVRRAFISRLGMTRDTHIINTHGPQVATEIRQRAASLEDDIDQIRELDRELVDRNINPGTTADLTVAATFVALERGMSI